MLCNSTLRGDRGGQGARKGRKEEASQGRGSEAGKEGGSEPERTKEEGKEEGSEAGRRETGLTLRTKLKNRGCNVEEHR